MSSVKNIDAYIDTLDTYVDEMKEETARLSSMIESLNNKIKEIEAEKEQLIKEQNEPKFEVAQDEKYYFVDFYSRGCNLAVTSDVYVNNFGDKERVEQNNCFKTKERAEEVLDKIKFLLKLERLHDIYCPNYKPNWHEESGSIKYCITYDTSRAKWDSCNAQIMKDAIQVYFPTDEIAQKVCDILNSEEQNNESNA